MYRPLLFVGAMVSCLLLLAAPVSGKTAMQQYVEAMQPGWNLGNTLDALGNETAWGNPLVTQEFIQQIKAQGFNSIRIPVTWDTGNRVGPAPTYTIDPAWLARVQQIVDWSLDAGLYVMINLHHDSDWVRTMPTNHDAVLAKFNALWSQIAPRFRDHSNKLHFESINEPSFTGADDATANALLKELNVSFFNIVRATGGVNATRPLVLPSVATNNGQVFLDSLRQTITQLNDPNLIATVHDYGYWPFSVNITGVTKFDGVAQDFTTAGIDRVYNTLVSQGIPVVVGEYGLLSFDGFGGAVERGEVIKFFEFFTGYCESKGITHQWWDNGAFFNRKTYQWNVPELYSYVMQSVTSRSSTAASDLVFVQSGAPADVEVPLNLNGNTFVSLARGSTILTAGVDYTIAGSSLTLKASLLAPYASGEYGEKTVLEVNFNAGLPWKLHVRHLGTPVLSAASGTKAGGLMIPVAFNGDLVATMEAKYAGMGQPYPGPAEWTSFKQYNDSFIPNYTNNTVAITKEFFAATTNNPVDFVFHFWSGRTVTYSITISGTAVTSNAPGSPPAAPASAGAFASTATEVTLSWLPPVSGATPSGYTIERATDSAFMQGYVSMSVGAVTSNIDTSVMAGTTYYYRVSAVNAGGTSSPAPTVRVTTPSSTGSGPATFVNISTRAFCSTGNNVTIGGFVIRGTTDKKVLVRAVGPTLIPLGISSSEVLADPMIEVHQGSAVIAANDNWGDNADPAEISAVGAQVGAAPLSGSDTKSSALVLTLQPGVYTFVASGNGGTSGIVLVEVYDADSVGAATQFVNISTRAKAGTGNGVTIGGFVISGSAPKQVLLRSVGPTLVPLGIGSSEVLGDPMIELHQGTSVIAVNDDWSTNANAASIVSTSVRIGAVAFSGSDTTSSALLLTLQPGVYTFVASGKGGTSGIGLVEVYDAD